eukprot:121117_1
MSAGKDNKSDSLVKCCIEKGETRPRFIALLQGADLATVLGDEPMDAYTLDSLRTALGRKDKNYLEITYDGETPIFYEGGNKNKLDSHSKLMEKVFIQFPEKDQGNLHVISSDGMDRPRYGLVSLFHQGVTFSSLWNHLVPKEIFIDDLLSEKFDSRDKVMANFLDILRAGDVTRLRCNNPQYFRSAEKLGENFAATVYGKRLKTQIESLSFGKLSFESINERKHLYAIIDLKDDQSPKFLKIILKKIWGDAYIQRFNALALTDDELQTLSNDLGADATKKLDKDDMERMRIRKYIILCYYQDCVPNGNRNAKFWETVPKYLESLALGKFLKKRKKEEGVMEMVHSMLYPDTTESK